MSSVRYQCNRLGSHWPKHLPRTKNGIRVEAEISRGGMGWIGTITEIPTRVSARWHKGGGDQRKAKSDAEEEKSDRHNIPNDHASGSGATLTFNIGSRELDVKK